MKLNGCLNLSPKHSYFPYITSEDMKKYVTHGKRPQVHPNLIWGLFSFWLAPTSDYTLKRTLHRGNIGCS